jgi:subtilisin-like proprotein convertase family protein
MSMQAMARWLGGQKKVALLLLAVGLAAVAALGLASAASAATFSSNSGITINDGVAICSEPGAQDGTPGTASPYPSGIEVSGLSGSVSDVNVTLTGLSHTFPDDMNVLLVGPEGQKTILMTDSGGGDPVSGIDLTFDDDAASGALPDEGPLSGGTYQPTRGTLHFNSCQVPTSFPATAPEGPYDSSLSVFNGTTNPNGTWQLYVIDDTPDFAGSITGWSLDISTSADTTAPTVTNTSPDGTVSRTANVTATFDEEVQNVTSSTFILERKIAAKVKTEPPKYVLVDATVSLNADGSYVLDPVQDLPKGDYRATITTDVTDMADNALEDPVVWTFKVAK